MQLELALLTFLQAFKSLTLIEYGSVEESKITLRVFFLVVVFSCMRVSFPLLLSQALMSMMRSSSSLLSFPLLSLLQATVHFRKY